MHRFQILHFPGPEMARLSKKMNSKFEFFKTKKIENLSFSHLTSFFSIVLLCLVKQCWKKLVKWENDKISIFLFWKIQILNSVFWTIQPFLDLENAKFGIYASKWVKPQNMGSEKWWDLFTNVSKISLWNLHGHIEHCVVAIKNTEKPFSWHRLRIWQ